MQDISWFALSIFVALSDSLHGLHSLQSTGAKAAQSELHEWGLGDRRFGMVVSWFLIGGDLYTAYTFYRSLGTRGQFAVTTFAAGSSR